MRSSDVRQPALRPGQEPPRPDTGRVLESAFRNHARRLYRYAIVVLADPDSAEDAVQQVFARLAGRSPGTLPFGYLLVAVRNECLSLLRKRRGGGRGPVLEPAEGRVCDAVERIALERALRELPAEQREVVYLRVWAGMSWDEIASVTGVGANTASSRYRYALARLRRGLIEEEDDAG